MISWENFDHRKAWIEEYLQRFAAAFGIDLLACAAYVDLNPIRAAMAQTLESSDPTSVQKRIETIATQCHDRQLIGRRYARSASQAAAPVSGCSQR